MEKSVRFLFIYDFFDCFLDNKMLGMNMKVERIGLDRIKAKINSLQQNTVKKVEDFDDFEKKYEIELKKKEEKKLTKKKIKPAEINLKIERKLIENGLLEPIETEIEKYGLPMSFISKKIKK